MDAPPKGPEEGLISPSNDPRDRRPVLLAAAIDLAGSRDGTAVLDVSGTSMLPTLSPGDAVQVRLGGTRRRLGDILVFVQGDSVVVHRYLGPARDRGGRLCLRTRGDGRCVLDSPLPPQDLIGRVEAVRREGAWFDLDGTRARGYAAAVAFHDLTWALAAHLARLGRTRGIGAAVERLDRVLLKCVDRLLFRRLHRSMSVPGSTGARDAR